MASPRFYKPGGYGSSPEEEEEPGLLSRGLHRLGSIAGTAGRGIDTLVNVGRGLYEEGDPLSRFKLTPEGQQRGVLGDVGSAFGVLDPSVEQETVGQQVGEAAFGRPSEDDSYGRAIGRQVTEFGADLARDPLTFVAGLGLGSKVAGGQKASRLLSEVPDLAPELAQALSGAARTGRRAELAEKAASGAFQGLMAGGAYEGGKQAYGTFQREGFTPRAAAEATGAVLSAGALVLPHLRHRDAGMQPDELTRLTQILPNVTADELGRRQQFYKNRGMNEAERAVQDELTRRNQILPKDSFGEISEGARVAVDAAEAMKVPVADSSYPELPNTTAAEAPQAQTMDTSQAYADFFKRLESVRTPEEARALVDEPVNAAVVAARKAGIPLAEEVNAPAVQPLSPSPDGVDGALESLAPPFAGGDPRTMGTPEAPVVETPGVSTPPPAAGNRAPAFVRLPGERLLWEQAVEAGVSPEQASKSIASATGRSLLRDAVRGRGIPPVLPPGEKKVPAWEGALFDPTNAPPARPELIEQQAQAFSADPEAAQVFGDAARVVEQADAARMERQAAYRADKARRREASRTEAERVLAVNEPSRLPLIPEQGEVKYSVAPIPKIGKKERAENLKKWFGASKTVDESGQPMTLYHGTSERGLNIISPRRAVETPGVVFLSDNPEVSGTFTVPREYGEPVYEDYNGRPIKPGPVHKLYAKMENPLVLEGAEAQRATDDSTYQGEVVRRAKEAGHDGIIFRNVKEGIGETYPGTTYGVFDARQIKSTKNRGTFDPTNPDIRYSAQPSPMGFYSQLQRVAEKIPQSMKGADLYKYLTDSKRGVKAEEMKSLGTGLLEAEANGRSGDSVLLSNLLQSPAFQTKGLSGLSVPARRLVVERMLAAGENGEVRDSIVKLLPVDVVNDLRRQKLTPEMLFHDESVLSRALTVNDKNPVSLVVDVARSVRDGIAGMRAEVPSVPLEEGLSTRSNGGLASETVQKSSSYDHINTPSGGPESITPEMRQSITGEAQDGAPSGGKPLRDLVAERYKKHAKGIETLDDGSLRVKFKDGLGDYIIREGVVEYDPASFARGRGREMFASEQIVGSAQRLGNDMLIKLKEGIGPETLGHEELHGLLALGRLKPYEIDALFKEHGFDPRKFKSTEDAQAAFRQAEEKVADQVGELIRQRLEAEKAGKSVSQPQWFDRMWSYLKRLWSSLSQRTTAEAVGERIASGQVYQPAGLVERGVGRIGQAFRGPETGLSEGGLSAVKSPEREANFQRWFGGSKVVDESGAPKTVYHGSQQKPNQFLPEKATNYYSQVLGIPTYFFSDNEPMSTSYGKKVTKANLSLQKPLEVNANGKTFDEILPEIENRLGIYKNQLHKEWAEKYAAAEQEYGEGAMAHDTAPKEVITELNRLHAEAMSQPEQKVYSHDGLIIKDVWDWGVHPPKVRGGEYKPYGTVYVAFEPTQIKSATGNVGTFDPTNPDIRYSATPPPQTPAPQTPTPGTPTPPEPTLGQKVVEGYKAGLVSGPGTQVANVIGNVGEQGVRSGETLASAIVDRLLPGERQRYTGEVKAELSGLFSKVPTAMGQLGKDIRDTFTLAPETPDPTAPIERRTGAIGGKTGRAVRVPFRLLGAFDNFFGTIGKEAELQKLAYRQAKGELKGADEAQVKARAQEIAKNPSEAMMKSVETAKASRLFKSDPDNPDEMIQALINLRRKNKALEVVLPFIETPANIAKLTIQRSPLGFAQAAKAYRVYKAAQLKGADAPTVQRLRGEAVDAIARPLLGSVLLGTFYGLAKGGSMTGSGPTDQREKSLLRQTGWQPYSFVLGEGQNKTYVPFNRFEPLSSFLGFAADAAESKDSKTTEEFVNKAMGSVVSNLTSKTYLQGVADAAEFINDPARFASSYLSSVSSAAVPNIVAKVAQAVDPTVRDVTPESSGIAGLPERIGNTLLARIPGASQSLPARRSATGDPIQREGNAVSRFLSPVQASTRRPEMRLEELMVEAGEVPGQPSRTFTVPGTGGKKLRLTDSEYAVLQEANEKASTNLRSRLGALERMDPEARAKVIKSAFEREREYARTRLMRNSGFRSRARKEAA